MNNATAIETAANAGKWTALLAAVCEAKKTECRNVLEYLWVEAMILVHRDARASRIEEAERRARYLARKVSDPDTL